MFVVIQIPASTYTLYIYTGFLSVGLSRETAIMFTPAQNCKVLFWMLDNEFTFIAEKLFKKLYDVLSLVKTCNKTSITY